jgi:hypothetical protein
LPSPGSHVNFPINIVINYLGLPNDSTHYNTEQTKEKMLMPSLDALKHVVTPRVLQRLTRLRKDSKGMLALGNQGTGIQESKFLLQKSLLK